MESRRVLLIAAATLVLAFAACGDDDASEPAASPGAARGADRAGAEKAGPAGAEKAGPAGAEKPEPEPGTEITVASSQFGDIIFDRNDQAIYLFDRETTSKPECYGDCAAAWPPVLTEGAPVASGAAKQSLLGTTERDDGTIQVTYAGQPLYYYAHEGPGQVLCHNVAEFGGLWLVLGANGEALA
jgi:predicted lipoprotein with Yx(FWY)xxD motif